MFLVTAALRLALGDSLRARLAAGMVLGLAALARANVLLLVPRGALYFLLEPGPGLSGGAGAGASWRRRLRGRPGRGAALLVAGTLAILSPVAWRNHHVSGE